MANGLLLSININKDMGHFENYNKVGRNCPQISAISNNSVPDKF